MASHNPPPDSTGREGQGTSQGKKKQGYTVRTRRGRYDSDKIADVDDMKDGELKYAVCTPIPSKTRPSLSGAFDSSAPKTNHSTNQIGQPTSRDSKKTEPQNSDVG